MTEHRDGQSIADIRSALARFVASSDVPEAIVLSGQWGVGKTYLWNSVVGAVASSKKRYGYVSLFGCESIGDFRDRLIEATHAVTDTSTELTVESSSTNGMTGALDRLRAAIGWANVAKAGRSVVPRRLAAKLSSLPVLQAYGPFYRNVMFEDVRDALICVDDFERRSASLAAADVLAEIANLRESRASRIILILNEDALGSDKEAFDRFEEKVFDARIRIAPSPEYGVSIAVPGDDPNYEQWLKCAVNLGLTNIRVLQRARSNFSILVKLFGEQPRELQTQLIYGLLLMVTCRFASRPNLPPLEYLRDYPRQRRKKMIRNAGGVGRVEEADDAESTEMWNATLDAIGWAETDELDLELIRFIEDGFPSKARLNAELRRKRKALDDAAGDEEIKNAWSTFHSTVEDNGDEIATAIQNAYRAHMPIVTPMTMDSAIRLLRIVGKSEVATDLAERFIECHRDDPETLSIEGNAFGDQILDPELRRMMDTAVRQIPVTKDLAEILSRISASSGWGIADVEYLATLTPQDFEAFFRSCRTRELPRLIEAGLVFSRIANAQENERAIGRNVVSALESIARSSALNSYRMRRYGISVP